MATTGVVNSKLMVIKVGAATVTCLVDVTLSMNVETRETTCKDSGSWNEALASKRGWTASGSGMFAYDATYGAKQLFDIYSSDQTTLATITWGTTVTGDEVYSGDAILTSLTFSAPGSDENTTFEFEFQGSGELASATNA